MTTINCFKIKSIDYEKLEKPKVSIILSTFRKIPKFELLYESLSHQTVKNFELVIADYLYDLHKEQVENLSKKFNIPTIHVSRGMENIHALNIGIINSSGDCMIHINDCVYYQYRWIEKHLLACTHNFVSLGSRYFTYSIDFPIEKHLTACIEVPSEQVETWTEHIKEKSHGIDKYLLLHFGEHDVVSPQDFRLLGLPSQFLTEDNLLLEAMPGWSYGGNTMASSEAFLELNGFNEEYDKGFGWADCDFGIRAFNKGYKMVINTSNWILEIQDKDHDKASDFLPHYDLKQSHEHNWKLYEEACNKGITWVNQNINLREMRKEILDERNKK